MANFSQKLKSAWFKCVESVGQGAANLADNAKQKLSEINMESRRKDIAAELPKMLMQLWKDGVALPEELTALLTEQNELEEALAAAKAARQAKKARPALTDGSDKEQPAAEPIPAEEATEELAPEAEEEAAEEVPTEEAQPVEETVATEE